MHEPPLDLNPQSPTYVGDDRAHDHAISECLGALSCPIHGENAAHVHHRDGNPRNNDVDNLGLHRPDDREAAEEHGRQFVLSLLDNDAAQIAEAVGPELYHQERCTTWDDPCEDQGCPVHGTRKAASLVRGTVHEYGGGEFRVFVDRDTMSYPDKGERGTWVPDGEHQYGLVKLDGGPFTGLYYHRRGGALELVRRIGDVDHVYDALSGEYKGAR